MGTAIDMAFDGATLAACPLSALVLSFAFYGFCGWASLSLRRSYAA